MTIMQHIGFIYEGKLRQNYYNEGRYWDSHLLGMLKEEYTEKQKQTNDRFRNNRASE